MSNLATVTPIKPHLEVVEHRVAELDDGYMSKRCKPERLCRYGCRQLSTASGFTATG